jgi:hypothetical protein
MGLDSKPKTLAREKNKLEKEGVDGLDHKQHQEEDELEKWGKAKLKNITKRKTNFRMKGQG